MRVIVWNMQYQWRPKPRANEDAVDVAAIRARVDHWTARRMDNEGRTLFPLPHQPYHVVREGDRLVVTSPKSRLFPSESWAFSPGRAESITGSSFFGARDLNVSRYVVDRIWLVHRVWINGKGASDALRIRGPGYGLQTVVGLDYNIVHNVMRPSGRRFGGSVSPTLEGPAAEEVPPSGVRAESEPDTVAPVAPVILTLSRLIAETTGRPLALHAEFVRQPTYNNEGA